MSDSPAPAPAEMAAGGRLWTCPFCPLLCDGYGLGDGSPSGPPALIGSACPRAVQGLARSWPAAGPGGPDIQPQVDGQPCDLAAALAAAAQILRASRQALFAGLGTDVAGARALCALAGDLGAISDAAQGEALMHGLRALQDRGAYTATLAEVRTRAELIVCVGGSPLARHPELWRRCGLDEPGLAQRHLVVLGGAPDDIQSLAGLPGVSAEQIPLVGDLFDTLALLAAEFAGAACVAESPTPLAALAARLREATYSVLVWEAARLPEHGGLIVETLNRIVGLLNRSTRAATLALGGGDGAATANQVYSWLTGLPLRSRAGPAGLEHEPLRHASQRLLADGAVDALLWVDSFGNSLTPALDLPHIVLGPPALLASLPRPVPPAQGAAPRSVLIPVSTPGVGAAGHLFRTDGMVLMPVHAMRDDGLPGVAEMARRLRAALAVAQELA